QHRARFAFGPVRLEQLAQPRNVTMDDGARRPRRTLTPQLVDQAVRRENVSGVQHEEREERTRATGGQGDTAAPINDLDLAQDVELDGASRPATNVAPAFSEPLAARDKMTAGRRREEGEAHDGSCRLRRDIEGQGR